MMGMVALAFSSAAKDLEFGGYTWTVRSGRGGPGPNAWSENNVWVDSATNLHLKISQQDGKWACAQITMKKRLGFGEYTFETVGRLDQLDDNVVLGLFNYPTADVGPDGTHEIDIEFARWGKNTNPAGNFTIWPTEKSKHTTKSFAFTQSADRAIHRFTWRSDQILFVSRPEESGGDQVPFCRWLYRPKESTRFISQQPMPVHVNLWLFRGVPPKNGREVEVILRAFRFAPE